MKEISESLEVKDKDDMISTVVKEYRWNMIEIIASHDLFMRTVLESFKKKGVNPSTESTNPDVKKIKAKL